MTRPLADSLSFQRVRHSAAYFAAGHRLLDALIRTLPAPGPTQQSHGCRIPSQRTSSADALQGREHTTSPIPRHGTSAEPQPGLRTSG